MKNEKETSEINSDLLEKYKDINNLQDSIIKGENKNPECKERAFKTIEEKIDEIGDILKRNWNRKKSELEKFHR